MDDTLDLVAYAKNVRTMGEAFKTVSKVVDQLESWSDSDRNKYMDLLALLLRGMNCDAAGYAAAAYRVGQMFEGLADRADVASRS